MPTGPEVNNDLYRNQRMSVQGLASEVGTVTASSGAATLNDLIGLVTTESLTTAQNAIYTLTLTNSKIAATDLVFVTVADGTNTQGTPMLGEVTPAAGSVVIKVINKHASAEALNGTLKIGYFVVKAL
jgi:hypothetical protein